MTNVSLEQYINDLPFFDSHSHAAGFDLGTPLDDRQGETLTSIVMSDYLAYLSGACWEKPLPPAKIEDAANEHPEQSLTALAPLLDEYRCLTTYAALREGIRELHPFAEPDIGPENWLRIDASIARAYKTHGHRAWLRQAMDRVGVVKQVQMTQLSYVVDHWGELPPTEREAQRQYLLPSLVLDGYFFSGFQVSNEGRERSQEITSCAPTTYREYLDFCGQAMDRFVAGGGNSVKLLCAYCRSLFFAEVEDREAEALFARGPEDLGGEELKKLQDNLVWHLLEMAVARDLPLLVHTGYSHPVAWADPEPMSNLMRSPRLAGLKMGMCHCGWPNDGAALIMARNYRHCYFDFSWTPMLSRTLGKQQLSLAIDMLPANKITMGTDCGTIEMFVGTVRLMRRVLFEVLDEKIKDGQFDVVAAKRLARKVLRDNAYDFFNVPKPELAETREPAFAG